MKVFLNPFGRLLTAKEAANWARSADAIICATEPLTELIKTADKLKLIAKIGVGLDNIPLRICAQLKIKVNYTPDQVTNPAAELAMAAILNLARKVSLADRNMRKGGWERLCGFEISELVIGIIGWGRIGQLLTSLLAPFNPREILINDIVDQQSAIAKLQARGVNIRPVSKRELLKNSDLISLHADLNPSSRHLINAQSLALVKKTAYLINLARGELIDEAALIASLNNKSLAGGFFDVFTTEPYRGELAKIPTTIVTSHMGAFTMKARKSMDQAAVTAVINFFNNQPLPNPVPIAEYDKQNAS